MDTLESVMRLAIEEACLSLREGNHGFGAAILKDGEIISLAHDREESDGDPTSHAELNAIREASKKLGKDLSGCQIVSTHEPCPMCASAIIWSGIKNVTYGYSIDQSILEGRKRIGISCRELFERSGAEISISSGIMASECAVLYQQNVRSEVKRLRHATKHQLEEYNQDSINRRLAWFAENKESFAFLGNDKLDAAYHLLLCRFGIDEEQAPVVSREKDRIVFHSMNFCPTLEACKILGLDTRFVCKRYNEQSTDLLVKQVDPHLEFARNYEKLRPHADYCEEMICWNK
mgnify:FL=1